MSTPTSPIAIAMLIAITIAVITMDLTANPPWVTPKQADQDQNKEFTFGKEVSWYSGEVSPKLYQGYLKVTDKGYVFKAKANEPIDPNEPNKSNKIFSIAFFDEDAEAEAVEISKKDSGEDENIQLLGYVNSQNPNKLDIIYGINVGIDLVSPNKK